MADEDKTSVAPLDQLGQRCVTMMTKALDTLEDGRWDDADALPGDPLYPRSRKHQDARETLIAVRGLYDDILRWRRDYGLL